MIIVDAKGLLVGRLASFVAKKALLGEKVVVVNSEQAVFSGSKDDIIEKYRHLYEMGAPRYGPFLFRRPDMFLRRIIRGMLPWKKARGREAYKRIKCYVGIPEEFKNAEFTSVDVKKFTELPISKRVTVGEICEVLRSWRS
ncbi:MAG: large subunit ribosomal protein [Candidatus Woesearchaeota archaeon]|nr:large subunit ribosomal protein [Candidatus Woesearchaeota archaeon]MDN5327733.1 large subunit ribosomal protein [Candidatus Woesearchaeota archaeon]